MGNTPAPPGTVTAGKLTAGQTIDHDGLTRLVADVIDGADRHVTVVFAEPDPSEERARRVRVGKSTRFRLVDVDAPDNEVVDDAPDPVRIYDDNGNQVGVPAPEVQQQIADSITSRNMQDLYPKAATVGDPEVSRAAVNAVLAAARAARDQPVTPSEAVEHALQRARDGELTITPDVAKAAAQEIISNGEPVETVRIDVPQLTVSDVVMAAAFTPEPEHVQQVAAGATVETIDNTIGIMGTGNRYVPAPAFTVADEAGRYHLTAGAVATPGTGWDRVTTYTYGDQITPTPPHLRVTLQRPPVAGRMAIIDGGTVIPISPDDTPTIGEYADALISAERTLSDDVAGWLFVGPWALDAHTSHTVTFTAAVQKANK